MLVNVMACAGDAELSDLAEPFANGIARHFAFLYAAGVGNRRGPEGRLARDLSLKQLDTHVYLDALVEVIHLLLPLLFSQLTTARSDPSIQEMGKYALSSKTCPALRRVLSEFGRVRR